MRFCFLVLLSLLITTSASAQDQISIICEVDITNNSVAETYRIISDNKVQFVLDQTQELRSFTGYFWIGKKKCKIKQKQLDYSFAQINPNNVVTNYSFQFPKGKVPTRVEYQYEVERNELMYLSSFVFESDKSYNLKIDVPIDYEIAYQVDANKISSNRQSTASKHLYQFENKLGLGSQNSSQIQLLIHPKDQEPSTYFAEWYLNLLNDQVNLSPASIDKIDSIVKSGSSKIGKAKLFFEYVRDEVKYYGHEVGLNTIQPQNVNEVLLSKFGDCKDISLLLHVGFQYLNIESYFGLLNLGVDSEEMYFLSSFNHAICVIQTANELLFLDATDKQSSFKKANAKLIDKKVLLLSSEAIKVVFNSPSN